MAGQLDRLWDQSTEQIVHGLMTSIGGVGQKAARSVALFGLGRLDAFPEGTLVTDALLSLCGRDPSQPFAGYATQLFAVEGLRNSSRR